MDTKTLAAKNKALRQTLEERKADNALLRGKAANTVMGNRRLLREIKRTLKEPKVR